MKKNQKLCNALYCCVFLIFVVLVTGSIHPSDARPDVANQDSSDTLTVMMPGEPGMTDTTGLIGEGENEFTSLHHEVSLYQNALLFDPTSDLMLNNLGLAYKHLGEYEKAEEAFIEAISLNSTCKEAWNNLGDLFCTTGRYHDAVSAYNESLRIDNTFAGAYNGKGYALKNIGELHRLSMHARVPSCWIPPMGRHGRTAVISCSHCRNTGRHTVPTKPLPDIYQITACSGIIWGISS